MPANTNAYKIILFDGICNFCNSSVNFIIDRDPKGKFKFAALQSDMGRIYIEKFNLSANNLDSMILVEGDNFFRKSTAVLRISKELKGLWPVFYYAFIWMPVSIRDFFYDIIAGNRYKFFGKSESCRIPTPELKNRFL